AFFLRYQLCAAGVRRSQSYWITPAHPPARVSSGRIWLPEQSSLMPRWSTWKSRVMMAVGYLSSSTLFRWMTEGSTSRYVISRRYQVQGRAYGRRRGIPERPSQAHSVLVLSPVRIFQHCTRRRLRSPRDGINIGARGSHTAQGA